MLEPGIVLTGHGNNIVILISIVLRLSVLGEFMECGFLYWWNLTDMN